MVSLKPVCGINNGTAKKSYSSAKQRVLKSVSSTLKVTIMGIQFTRSEVLIKSALQHRGRAKGTQTGVNLVLGL